MVTANGFKPDSTVNWKLVNSKNQIPLYGYFDTNADGGFYDATYLDDLVSDNYKMYLGPDDNIDNELNLGRLLPLLIFEYHVPNNKNSWKNINARVHVGPA